MCNTAYFYKVKKWREIKQEFLDTLDKQMDEREANTQFKLLFESYTGNYNYTSFDLEKNATEEDVKTIAHQIERLKSGEPIQYVIGYAWFDDMLLFVNQHVLIPRQETEELVYWIKNNHQQKPPKTILDIGTGSGAIALALANHFPETTILGIDISEEALQVAEHNRKKLAITNCSFQKMDILQEQNFNRAFDLIVSNPPYITEDYETKMEQTVTEHEPHLALFVPNDKPLLFYRTIADFAKNHLTHAGNLYFEINEFFAEELHQMLKEKDFENIELKKDLNENWRMAKGTIGRK